MRTSLLATVVLGVGCLQPPYHLSQPRTTLLAHRYHARVRMVAAGSLCTYGSGTDDAALSKGVAAVREQNAAVHPLLQDVRERRFFRFYAADLLAGCSYMPTSEEPCELGECEVDAAEDVPDELVERDESESDFELDSWARWDQPSDFTEYYDVIDNAEGAQQRASTDGHVHALHTPRLCVHAAVPLHCRATPPPLHRRTTSASRRPRGSLSLLLAVRACRLHGLRRFGRLAVHPHEDMLPEGCRATGQ